MPIHIDSWPWKIAIVLALVGVREFVRMATPKDSAGQNEDVGKWLIETIDSAAIAIGLVLFIVQPFLLQAFFIPSGSMEDTLRVGDRLLVSKFVYHLRNPQFQDVVVFIAPPAAIEGNPQELAQDGGETDFIKRCIGTPGDVVYAENRKYYRNSVLVADESGHEPYVKWSTTDTNTYSYDMKIVDGKVYSRETPFSTMQAGAWMQDNTALSDQERKRIDEAKPGPVPPNVYLMLGDHRNNSNDGHVWGFVPRANIVGKAVCVFWPPTRVGLVDRMSFHPRAPQSTLSLAH